VRHRRTARRSCGDSEDVDEKSADVDPDADPDANPDADADADARDRIRSASGASDNARASIAK
jgi:hypothetical protein